MLLTRLAFGIATLLFYPVFGRLWTDVGPKLGGGFLGLRGPRGPLSSPTLADPPTLRAVSSGPARSDIQPRSHHALAFGYGQCVRRRVCPQQRLPREQRWLPQLPGGSGAVNAGPRLVPENAADNDGPDASLAIPCNSVDNSVGIQIGLRNHLDLAFVWTAASIRRAAVQLHCRRCHQQPLISCDSKEVIHTLPIDSPARHRSTARFLHQRAFLLDFFFTLLDRLIENPYPVT